MQYGVTVQDLIDANFGINPYNLQIGQQIYIYPNRYWVSINQVELLKQMNLVWEQHIMWTRMLLISIAENLNDLEATQTRLLENPKDIANVFRVYYGNDIANTIQRLLTEHLVIGKNLIVALKEKNQKRPMKLQNGIKMLMKWLRHLVVLIRIIQRKKYEKCYTNI